MGFIGEVFVEVLMYGTYYLMKNLMERLPITWNKIVLKVTCVVLGILFWIIGAFVIIQILETVLS